MNELTLMACRPAQIPERNEQAVSGSSPGPLVWGQGPEELGDGADGRPDHRRRVVRGRSDDAGQATAMALLPQGDVRAANGLVEHGADEVSAGRLRS